jgi:hypothetical protein
MRRRSLTHTLPLAAAALVGAMLPLGPAAGAPAEEEPAFSGFSSEVWGSPVEIELYEPTIPIPSTPQFELLLGYSSVVADSSSAKGRASYLWPGDSVGEGAKTVIENLGLPAELSGPLAARGYPVQVNSHYPSGPETQADEPFPGTVQRTGASAERVFAQTGYSTDCSTDEPAGGGGAPGGPGLPGVPGLPELPGLPAPLAPLAPASASHGGERTAVPSEKAGADEKAAEEPAPCPVPAQLAQVVDIGGYTSSSSNVNDATRVQGVNRAAVSDISLLGGIVTIGSVRATATATSNGAKGTATGEASYGVVTIAGERFRFGPQGLEAAGQKGDIPGLPDEPEAALAELGLRITRPTPVYEATGDEAHGSLVGLSVEIDLKTVNKALTQLPLSDLFIQLPDDLGPLKSALLSAANLASRVVVNLAVADATVDTVQGIDIPVPTVPTPGTDPEGAGAAGGASGAGSGGAGTPAPPTSGAPTAGGAAPAAGTLPADSALTSGLPKLFSIPGLLLVAGLAGAGVAGSYLRRIGALALGGGAACPHGLDSGLPDLRKA